MSDPVAITMPKWGLTMTEGKVVRWLRPEGAAVARGEELLEIETSKITNVVEAETDGMLRRVVAPEGTTLPIGALLAVIAAADAPAATIDDFVGGFVVIEPTDEGEEAAEKVAPRELDAGGRRLRYLELGEGGETLLLLHGFGADLNGWMFNQPALAQGRRVIALDLPGHGGSSKDVGSGNPDELADAVEAALDALALDRVHLVGHSLGGVLAALVAARNPARVASLTLIAPAGLGTEINATFIDGFVRMARRRDATEVLSLLLHDPSLVSRTMVEDVLRYKRIDGVTGALEAIAHAWFPGGHQACDVREQLASLTMPVQIIWGRDDKVIPAAHGEALGAHVLDAAGHLPHMEKSGEVNRLIAGFLTR
jgi:pyruvate dehydrogenase E2 component (dihydrolipoamide acetyltransferase)